MSDTALWALTIVVAVNTLFICGLTAALFMINQKVAVLTERLEPVALRAADTLARVEKIAGEVEGRAQRVLEQTSSLVDSLARRVDTTTAVAEEAISQPLIGAASVVAGIHRGLEVYREQAVEKGDAV